MLRFIISSDENIHINSLRKALLNYIVAKQKNDSFLIAIEDSNKEKYIEGKDAEIVDILKKFTIKADQTIYRSENIKTYQKFAKKLILDGKAYICFCNNKENKCSGNCLELTQKEIQSKLDNKEQYSVFVKKPNIDISFKDIIENNIEVKSNEIEDIAILNKNQEATNIFATTIDDMTTNTTTIIEDKDNIINTTKEIYIQKLFNYTPDIIYAHIPKIIDNKEQTTIESLFKQGFLPDAIINYLLSLNYKTPSKIFYLPDAIKWYDISKINTTEVEFNIKELRDINKAHLMQMDSKKLSSIFGFADSDIGELLKLYLSFENIATINELESKFKLIFSKKKCKDEYKDSLKELSNLILKAPMINNFSDFKSYLLKKSNLDEDIFNNLLSTLLVGENSGINLEKVYPLIKSYILEVARCQ